MEVEALKNKDKLKHSFILKKSTAAFANALRRTMINEVPAMAIESVEIKKNSGIQYDEMIAHRLGLVVLKTDLKSYNLPEKCTCKGEGCAQCQLKLILKAKGPGYVYAGDLKSEDPKCNPIHEKTIITKLLKNQELELIATATLGQGKKHTKWSPCLAYYKHPAIIDIKNNNNADETAKLCPVNVFENKNGKLAIKDQNACHLCLACEENGDVKISEKKDSFMFTIESWGQLDPKVIAKKSTDIINDKCNDFIEKVKDK